MAIDKLPCRDYEYLKYIPRMVSENTVRVTFSSGISTNNLYAYADLPGASLQDCPWKLVSSDILVILFHCSPQTEHNVNVMAITGLSCCSHRICQSAICKATLRSEKTKAALSHP